jgi:transcriptional regulator with GAF, ATPase, and Fis domain
LACFANAAQRCGIQWLQTCASHATVSIANARAFAEIERLRSQLELENVYLREEVKVAFLSGNIAGGSPAFQRVLEQVELVAPTSANVLVLGESGTGKEMIANASHYNRKHRKKPFIKINCAAIPETLIESELFGHEKGAFTGACAIGPDVSAADGGTLFLDEIGEIPLELQSKLLRAIQEGQFERVGEERTRRVDVRIVATTNRDLPRKSLRAFPAGPLLSAQRVSDSSSAAARRGRRHPRAHGTVRQDRFGAHRKRSCGGDTRSTETLRRAAGG